MPSASPKTHTPICPKCGYDQSGTIATWKTQCPVEGMCSECGLIFLWTNVLNPDHITLSWYCEHAPSLWNAFKRTPATCIRLVVPFVYWRRVTVFMHIKLSMLTCWCLVLIVLAHIASSITMGFGRWAEHDWYKYSTLNRTKPLILAEYLSLISNALFSPLITIYGYTNTRFNLYWYSYGYESTTDYLLIASFPFGVSLFWLIIIAVIPTTRRIAKLRTHHILRAVIIALTSCILLFEFGRLISALFMLNQPMLNWLGLVLGAGVVLTTIWHFLFWPAAIIVGWKIRPAKLLVMLGTIAAFLGACTLTLFIGLV